MTAWLEEDVDDEGATPWALGDDGIEPLARWDADGDEDLADEWLDRQLQRQPRVVVDQPATDPNRPVGAAGANGEDAGGGVALRRSVPVRSPRRRRADPEAAADLPAPDTPGYVRDRRGTWRYAATGRAVPGARDLTLRALYRFPTHHGHVLVPVDLIRSEPALAWCLGWKGSLTTRLTGGHSVTVVPIPVAEWERRADVPFGVWAPELAAGRLLGIGERRSPGRRGAGHRRRVPGAPTPAGAGDPDREQPGLVPPGHHSVAGRPPGSGPASLTGTGGRHRRCPVSWR